MKCSIESCKRQILARSWCSLHYDRWRKHGNPNYISPSILRDTRPCKVLGCSSPRIARGWCTKHYQRWQVHDRPETCSIRERGQGTIHKDGYIRIRKGTRRSFEHIYIWEQVNGSVPDGYLVHHKDGNKQNNEIANLELMKWGEHTRLHSLQYWQKKRGGS